MSDKLKYINECICCTHSTVCMYYKMKAAQEVAREKALTAQKEMPFPFEVQLSCTQFLGRQ